METHFPMMETSELGARAAQLQTDVKVVVRDIEELVKAAAGQLNEKTSGQLHAVLQRAKGLAQRCEQKASAGLAHADRAIRQHPYQSLGVAFAAGALIGVLVNRR
jgi:ElaB/YqjD/DUF883 family membrane-anchored ribosome-binding protein